MLKAQALAVLRRKRKTIMSATYVVCSNLICIFFLEIIIKYKLREIADSKEMVYSQANRGMFELPQSGLLGK